MKVLREVWDFVAGSSVVAPIGVAIAITAALLPLPLAAGTRAIIFVALIFATFAASTYERSS